MALGADTLIIIAALLTGIVTFFWWAWQANNSGPWRPKCIRATMIWIVCLIVIGAVEFMS